METVRNLNTLKAMQKKGLITFDNSTGDKIQGLYSSKTFTCYYVKDGSALFEYKGHKYGVKYFDGCFNPFVIKYS